MAKFIPRMERSRRNLELGIPDSMFSNEVGDTSGAFAKMYLWTGLIAVRSLAMLVVVTGTVDNRYGDRRDLSSWSREVCGR